MADAPVQFDRTKIRIGLAMVSVIFIASLVLIFVAEGAVAQAIFVAIAVVCLVRIIGLARWLRRGGPTADAA